MHKKESLSTDEEIPFSIIFEQHLHNIANSTYQNSSNCCPGAEVF